MRGLSMVMRSLAFQRSRFEVEVTDEADESVLAEIFSLREYELVEPAIARAQHGILDIGAHKGFFILYVRALNATVPVWAYEPEEKNFAVLKRHLEGNRMNGVVAKNAAVAGAEGTVLLNVSADSHNHSIVVDPGLMKRQKVSAVSLEQVLQKMAKTCGGCDLIKMDVEGAEFDIFASAGPLTWTVPEFFLEYHEYGPDMKATHLKVLFEKQGYSVKILPSRFDKRMGFLWAKK